MIPNADSDSTFTGWAIVEIMGHRRLGGYLSEQTVAGKGMVRVDIPGDTDTEAYATQLYGPDSVFCITPVTEEMARAVAKANRPQPVTRWELPAAERRAHLAAADAYSCGTCGRIVSGECDDVDEDGDPICPQCLSGTTA